MVSLYYWTPTCSVFPWRVMVASQAWLSIVTIQSGVIASQDTQHLLSFEGYILRRKRRLSMYCVNDDHLRDGGPHPLVWEPGSCGETWDVWLAILIAYCVRQDNWPDGYYQMACYLTHFNTLQQILNRRDTANQMHSCFKTCWHSSILQSDNSYSMPDCHPSTH